MLKLENDKLLQSNDEKVKVFFFTSKGLTTTENASLKENGTLKD